MIWLLLYLLVGFLSATAFVVVDARQAGAASRAIGIHDVAKVPASGLMLVFLWPVVLIIVIFSLLQGLAWKDERSARCKTPCRICGRRAISDDYPLCKTCDDKHGH